MQQETTANADAYHTILEWLRAAIKQKFLQPLTKGVLLLHHNAQPHNANATQHVLQCFPLEIFEYPAYNPDLAACNYHLFPALKDHLGIHKFQTDDNMKTAVIWWFQLLHTHFY